MENVIYMRMGVIYTNGCQ